jgi:hypothetical protein
MATNKPTGDNARKGAVRKRTQLRTKWTTRRGPNATRRRASALALPLQSPARLYPIEVSVDVNLQQRRRMVGRPACHLRLNAAKAQASQIKRIDKDIDRPDRIVLAQIVIQSLGKQSALTAVIARQSASSNPPAESL